MEKEEFYTRVYEIVAQIPEGKVMSYGQIGFMLGSPYYARRVGRAMANAPKPLGLPCHRVVKSSGKLAPPQVFGGEGVQYRMLKGEGVSFKSNGCVDMKKCLWMP